MFGSVGFNRAFVWFPNETNQPELLCTKKCCSPPNKDKQKPFPRLAKPRKGPAELPHRGDAAAPGGGQGLGQTRRATGGGGEEVERVEVW